MESLVVGAEKDLEAIFVTAGTAASSYPGIAFCLLSNIILQWRRGSVSQPWMYIRLSQ